MLLKIVSLAIATSCGHAQDEAATCPASGCRPGDDLAVPNVIIGCWQLLERHKNPEKAIDTLTSYAEKGFRTFDTADIYGKSEEILGDFRARWEKNHPDSEPLRFFTKYVTDSPTGTEAGRINQQSRKHMGVNSLDLVQFHWWSLAQDGSRTTFLKAGGELTKLKESGQIKHLGGCNMDTTHLSQMVDSGMAVASNQVQYSLLDRRAENLQFNYCKEKGIKLTIFGVVAGGLLSESFLGLTKGEAERKLDSVSRNMYWSSLQRWTNDWSLFQKLLKTLKSIGEKHSPPLSIAAVASGWALWQLNEFGAGGGLILGVRDARHLDEHTSLLRGEVALNAGEVAEIGAVLDKGNRPQGDIWHQERGWA